MRGSIISILMESEYTWLGCEEVEREMLGF